MTVYEALDIVSQGFADSDEGLTAVKTIADYNKELEGKIVTLDEALASAHAEKDDALNLISSKNLVAVSDSVFRNCKTYRTEISNKLIVDLLQQNMQ